MISALVDLLEAATSLQRIYPDILPQKPTLPAVTYQKISTVRLYHMQGEDGLPAVRVQIDAWADTKSDAETIADQIRNYIGGFVGSSGGTDFRGIFFDTERSLYESEPKIYRSSQDFIVWYRD